MTIRQRHTCRCSLAVIALTCGLTVSPASGAEQSDGNDRFTVRTGLAFCDVDPQLCLDLYLPKQDGGPVPCVMVIQGGGFLPQDGQRFRPFASYLAEHGMAAALIAYRGRPDHKYRDTVADVKAAVRFVREVGGQYNIDVDRIGAMGRSAGGTLAGLLAVTGGMPEFEGDGGHAEYSSRIQAAVAYAGVFDFVARFTDPEQIALQPMHVKKKETNGEWIGAAFSPDDSDWLAASAIRHVDKDDSPVLFLHCRNDTTVPWIQSRDMCAKMREAGVASSVKYYATGGHGFKNLGEEPMADMVGFFRKALGGPSPADTSVHHSSDFGWTATQDVSEQLASLLESGKLTTGEELILDHRYRLNGSHTLPDHFTLSAVEGAGFDVTDAVKPKSGRPLLELGNNNTLRNLTITYLNTPKLGPAGEKHGVDFTSRLGIQAQGKHDLRIENCRLTGSIGHHIRLTNCSKVEVIGTHVAGGHWSVMLTSTADLVFRRCLVEKCQGDGIKTGGGADGAVRRVLVEQCVFQDNGRDGIDTTGGFNESVIRNCVFRRLGVCGLDLKSHYESRTGRIEDLAPENIGILVEKCLFHDMPNAIVLTTLDCGRRAGPGNELLNAANIKDYAPHDIDIIDCVVGHAEKPLRSAKEGGYGVNYPSSDDEYMRMILLKDAYSVRYRNARFFGERIMPVYVSSIGGSRHLSEEAAQAIEPTVSGNVANEPYPEIQPGQTEVPFACGPRPLD